MNKTQIMAHIIDLPFVVEFTPQKRRWEICTARLAGFAQDFTLSVPGSSLNDDDSPMKRVFAIVLTPGTDVPVQHPPPREQMFSLANIGGRHDDLLSRIMPGGVPKDDVYDVNPSLEVLATFEAELAEPRYSDPWAMRDHFLSLPHTMKELQKFFNKWGPWDGLPISRVYGKHYPRNERSGTYYIVPETIWEAQAKYRAALSGDPEAWLSQSGRIPTPERRTTAPFFAIRDTMCLSAIQTTITLDKMRRIPFRLCERFDCEVVFKLESNHDRRFCTQACAHLVSVRKGREARRMSKLGGKK